MGGFATHQEIGVKEWREKIADLARQAEPAVLAQAEAHFTKAMEEHERQTAGYSFECRRFGDFLTVFVERRGNGVGGKWEREPKKLSTSLNLAKTRNIELRDGHCFDRRGVVRYMTHLVRDDGTGSGWGTGAGYSPWEGHHYEVVPMLPNIPVGRRLVEFDKPRSDAAHFQLGGDQCASYRTENYPRPASDDQIRFKGVGATIYAPAGKGKSVLDAIMAEVANGYERLA